jgi:hypothetical protein
VTVVLAALFAFSPVGHSERYLTAAPENAAEELKPTY